MLRARSTLPRWGLDLKGWSNSHQLALISDSGEMRLPGGNYFDRIAIRCALLKRAARLAETPPHRPSATTVRTTAPRRMPPPLRTVAPSYGAGNATATYGNDGLPFSSNCW